MPVIQHIEIQENDIVNKLNTGLADPNVEVEVLPETEDAFQRPYQKGRISVCYNMSKFGEVSTLSLIRQEDAMEFHIIIQARKLRDTHGIFDLFNKVKKIIIGFTPTHCGRIYAKSFDFEERFKDVWVYSFKVCCKNLLVENYDTDSDQLAPELNSVTFNNVP